MFSISRKRIAALAATAVATLGLAGAGSAEAAYRAFESPTGNIACVYDSDSYADPVLSCDLRSADVNYTMTPWSRVSYFDSAGLYGTYILGYGRSFKAGALKCTMRYSGMTCTSKRSGRGFFLSRDNWHSW